MDIPHGICPQPHCNGALRPCASSGGSLLVCLRCQAFCSFYQSVGFVDHRTVDLEKQVAKLKAEIAQLERINANLIKARNEDVADQHHRALRTEKLLEEAQDNYRGAMADNEDLVTAYRRRMPTDRWLNANYPIKTGG